jgi:hypothetical protein
MSTTTLYAIIAALALGFLVGGVAAWQAGKEIPLPAVEFSSPFRPDEAVGNLNLEYISVRNSGDAPVDLSNWTLSNQDNEAFTFPEGFALPAGGLVTVYTGCGEDIEGTLHWCAKEQVWADKGGKATLRMPDDTVVDTHAYDSRCPTCDKK